MLGVKNTSKEEHYAYLAGILESVLNQTASRDSVTEVVHQTPELRDPNAYKQQLLQLQEGILALQRQIECNEEVGKTDDQFVKTPSAVADRCSSPVEEDTHVEPCACGEECMVVLLPLLTASMRSVRFAQSKMIAMSLLTDSTKYLPDNIILQRVLPHFVNVLQEATTNHSKEEYACVISLVGDSPCLRLQAIRCITTILSNIASLPHSDFNIVTDYIIPNLITIQQK